MGIASVLDFKSTIVERMEMVMLIVNEISYTYENTGKPLFNRFLLSWAREKLLV